MLGWSRTTAAAAAALSLMAGAAHAQYAGANTTGTAGLIAIDKVGDKIRFYDPKTLAEIKQLDPPGKSVHELTLSYDHKTAFTPLYGDGVYGANEHPDNKVLVIDLQRQEIAKVIDLGVYHAPHGMAATRDGKLWVVCDQQAKLLLIDPVAGAIEAVYDAPAHGPHFIVLLPDESKLYLSEKEGPLAVFDVARRAFLPSVPIGRPGVEKGNGSGGEGLTPTPDGRRIIVADNDRNDLHVIDTRTDREIDRVPLKDNPFSNIKRSRLVRLHVSPDGKYLVATGIAGSLAWIIDAADYRKQWVIPVAKGPQGVAFTADGRQLVVSSHDSGLLTVIDLAAKTPVRAVDGGAGIEVLAYY